MAVAAGTAAAVAGRVLAVSTALAAVATCALSQAQPPATPPVARETPTAAETVMEPTSRLTSCRSAWIAAHSRHEVRCERTWSRSRTGEVRRTYAESLART